MGRSMNLKTAYVSMGTNPYMMKRILRRIGLKKSI